ncbi:MAG TPA: glycosyltransferase family 4 protein [Nitrospira sp.]|nr:glycosyltransferase family 4 protein [Nitrospira sp.]
MAQNSRAVQRAGLKILHVTPTYFPAVGGAESHLKELSEGLASRGHDVTVVTVNVRNAWQLFRGVADDLPGTEVINGVNVVRLDPNGRTVGSWMRRWVQARGGWRSLRFVFGEDGMEILTLHPQPLELIPYLLRTRADIVTAMNWHWSPAYYTYLARKLKNFVFVGIPLFHTAEGWCRRPIYRKLAAATSAIVANTAYEQQYSFGLGARRVEVGGVGVHPETFTNRDGKAIRARYQIGDAPIVGFVGRQGVNKGVVELVQAMKIVWRWNSDVRVIIAGHESTEHQDVAVRSAFDRLTASEQARLIRISRFEETEKPSLYDAFDVFVLPSIGESFGLAYLEAWLCGKPVIGAKIGSTQCVIEDGVDGLLVEPGCPEDVADKIITLLADREKRESLGRKGYVKTVGHYTWDRVVDRVENLYRDLHMTKVPVRQRCAKFEDASSRSQA